MLLTDYPRFVPPRDYTRAIDEMVEKLRHYPGVVSIYQIGGVGNPGISDIDLLVIFSDDARCLLNPLDGLTAPQRYLYAHNLFGATSSVFTESQRYDFFHNYKLLHGREFDIGHKKLPREQLEMVNVQSALEYLIKMYINMTIERTYGIVRTRGVLLLAKAMKYDLDALGMASGPAAEMVRQIIHWRNHWFDEIVSADALVSWHDRFYDALGKVIEAGITGHGFFVPAWADLRIAANVILERGRRLGYRRHGVCLPSAFGRLGRKYFNFQHRLNRFVFEIPLMHEPMPAPVRDRHVFITDICELNRRNLPHFIPAPYGLSIFRRT
jgi:hypothetical protein